MKEKDTKKEENSDETIEKVSFDDTIEGELTCDDAREKLKEIFEMQPLQMQKRLVANSKEEHSAIDYIARFIFWMQCLTAAKTSIQYCVMQQLIDAYTLHKLFKGNAREMFAMTLVPDNDDGRPA